MVHSMDKGGNEPLGSQEKRGRGQTLRMTKEVLESRKTQTPSKVAMLNLLNKKIMSRLEQSVAKKRVVAERKAC